MIAFKDIPGLCATPIFARNHDDATTLCLRLNDRLGLDDNDVDAMTTATWEQHESARLIQFNDMYEKYSTRITGDIHNSFWQIIVNEKQPDAAFEALPFPCPSYREPGSRRPVSLVADGYRHRFEPPHNRPSLLK